MESWLNTTHVLCKNRAHLSVNQQRGNMIAWVIARILLSRLLAIPEVSLLSGIAYAAEIMAPSATGKIPFGMAVAVNLAL